MNDCSSTPSFSLAHSWELATNGPWSTNCPQQSTWTTRTASSASPKELVCSETTPKILASSQMSGDTIYFPDGQKLAIPSSSGKSSLMLITTISWRTWAISTREFSSFASVFLKHVKFWSWLANSQSEEPSTIAWYRTIRSTLQRNLRVIRSRSMLH